uniref:Autophagy-related protein 9 n=1 Tax=Magallana gigas TaxID=29159 RepID=A0A8W8MFS0_MAGGI
MFANSKNDTHKVTTPEAALPLGQFVQESNYAKLYLWHYSKLDQGLIVTACKVFIPDEHLVYCPEILMRNILAHVHYMPPDWSGNAHTSKVRNEFSIFFQYKVAYLFEELLSPLVTPIVLCFSLRHKSMEIVDFFP